MFILVNYSIVKVLFADLARTGDRYVRHFESRDAQPVLRAYKCFLEVELRCY